MIEPNLVQAVKTQLFSTPGTKVFTILDGASVPDLLINLATLRPEYICLYRGELASDMAEVAPYLAFLNRDDKFTDWVISHGWGNHWGIFGLTQADLKALRQHFRKFLIVYDESAKSLYFRYYDPRVLRVYLPTCNTQELQTVFGPVSAYLMEDEDLNVRCKFMFVDNVLREDTVKIA